ncbi:hypothetical protein BC332_18071 [Capsicum chinense]|nr:hypothetical protein BC332_18071 [Capsicum chinense]
MADRHKALGIKAYQIAQNLVNDNNQSKEVKQIATQFVSIFLESMTAASLGTHLTFDSEYTPPNKYEKPPSVQVRRRSAAPRERARRRGGRGG